MRKNKYVHIVPLNKDFKVIFNGMNYDFIIVFNDVIPSYIEILNNPGQYITTHPTIIEEMQRLKIIVADDFNEKEHLVNKRNNYIQAKEYKTSIIPTFECNYVCWYCTQEHQPVNIEPEKIELIINHIKTYLLENDIESYVLSWFGGEPLTQPEIIDYMSGELRSFCNEHDIEFSGGVTTNGALLTSSTAEILTKHGINHFQIAIDGDQETHDKNKFDTIHESSFNLILSNVANLLRINPDAKITLRFNYTPATVKKLHLVDEINKFISPENRGKIRIDLQHVWQIDERIVKIEDLCKLQRKFSENGYQFATDHVFSICYVDKIHYNTIYYNGKVEKCDIRSMDNLRGEIDADGHIIWHERPIIHDYDIMDKDCCCSDCSYYPVCFCGCPVRREEIIQKSGTVKCGHTGDFSKLHYRISDYCWRMIHNLKVYA